LIILEKFSDLGIQIIKENRKYDELIEK